MPTTAPSDLAPRPLAELAFFWRFAFVFLIVGLAYAAIVELVPDEAFYWVWSRHLEPGYLDHPPMIASLMWLGTHVLGSTEIGVRLPGVLMSAGAMIVTVLLARRVFRDERAAVWVGIIWLTSPLLSLVGLIFTPDMPAIFFSTCGLAFAMLIADRDDHPIPSTSAGLWLLFGLFTGLALLSKYTAILLPAGVALAFLLSSKGRLHFRRPWIYLGGILAVVIFSPVIAWNARHHWASFLFQLRHGTAPDGPTKAVPAIAAIARVSQDLGTYLGEQLLVWTPILFTIAILVLAHFWRRYRRITQADRVLLWTGTLPLVFFGAMCLKSHHSEANWPAFAYFPISLLTARWLSETWSARRVNWAKGGCQLALGFVVVLHLIALPPVTKWMLGLPFKIPHNLRDLYGWHQYGQVLGTWSNDFAAPVFCNRYEDGGEAAFYMPGQPDVWCIGIGSRPTAFEYFDERDFTKIPRILWVGGHHELFCRTYGYRVVDVGSRIFFVNSRRYRGLQGFLLERSPQVEK